MQRVLAASPSPSHFPTLHPVLPGRNPAEMGEKMARFEDRKQLKKSSGAAEWGRSQLMKGLGRLGLGFVHGEASDHLPAGK